ncbi:hypothetical protein GQ42DRAFT_165738 [Ramicandelaber brevisporus]|nr:hypothetical protein GQ42DRAFT_165738 [Ramicandelaber brevisporus]
MSTHYVQIPELTTSSSAGYGGYPPATGSNSSNSSSSGGGGSVPAMTHSIHGLSQEEALRSVANRILYSRFYTIFYAAMASLSVISLIVAIFESSDSCPSRLFVFLEVIVCLAMIVEVGTRLLAYGTRSYLKSWWNFADVVLVTFCVITLIVLLTANCSTGGGHNEEVFNTMLLVIRNTLQVFRLLATIRKNSRHRTARDLTVVIDDPHPSASAIDGASPDSLADDLDDSDLVGVQVHSGDVRNGGSQRNMGSTIIFTAAADDDDHDDHDISVPDFDSYESFGRQTLAASTSRRSPQQQ